MLTCLREKIVVGDLPVLKDIPLPPLPEGVMLDGTGKLIAPTRRDEEEEEDFKERRKAHYAYKRLVDKVGYSKSAVVVLFARGDLSNEAQPRVVWSSSPDVFGTNMCPVVAQPGLCSAVLLSTSIFRPWSRLVRCVVCFAWVAS